jgi:micrococcal nuclease
MNMLLLISGVVALIASGCDVEELVSATGTSGSAGSTDLPSAKVRRVVDGDTIIVVIDGREERLRYIGVDAPESVQPGTPVECFGLEASAENRRLVEGRTVYLEKDVSERDRFGRLLRYVYVDDPDSGERLFVNLELVARGYAQAVTYPPDVRHEQTFRAAQRAARDESRGLWGQC